MKIACMQPYIIPAIQYFQLIYVSDFFVFLDDVNFINKGFIHRNFILNNGEKEQITLNLKKKSQNKLINEIELISNQNKFLKKIYSNYNKSSNFRIIYPVIEQIFNSKYKYVSDINCDLIMKISSLLKINTKFEKSSNLKILNLKGEKRILKIVKTLGGKSYINSIGGLKLYNKNNFQMNKISLSFLQSTIDNNYKKKNLSNNEVSIIHLLMNEDLDQLIKSLESYRLITN